MHFTIRILDACPELGLQAGDLVTFEPELRSPENPLFVHRPWPANLGRLVLLLESGGAQLLTSYCHVDRSTLCGNAWSYRSRSGGATTKMLSALL